MATGSDEPGGIMYTRWIIWGVLLCLLLLGCNDIIVPEDHSSEDVVPTSVGITLSPFSLPTIEDSLDEEPYVAWSDTIPSLKPGGAIGKGVVVVPVVRMEDRASRFYAISYGDHSDAAITFSYPIKSKPIVDLWLYSGPYDWRYERITHFGIRVNTLAPSGKYFQCLDSTIILREVYTNTVVVIGQDISTAIPLPRPLRRDVLQGQEGYLPEYSYMGHSRDRLRIQLSVLQLWDCDGRKPNPLQFTFDFYNEKGELAVSTPCSIGFIPSAQ